jgi:hypothetical protein
MDGTAFGRKDSREMTNAVSRISEVRPYVERAVQDEELRKNVQAAFGAARNVYDELLGNRGVTGIASRVATDTDVQADMRRVLEELRSAAGRLQSTKEDHSTRNTILLLTGIIVGALYNPWTGAATRSWLKEKVLGPSDEFTYSGNSGSNSGSTPPEAA